MLTKKINPEKCIVHWNDGINLPEDMVDEIHIHWESLDKSFIFNGCLARLDSWQLNVDELVLNLSPSDYQTLLYSNEHVDWISLKWGEKYLAKTLGISAVVKTADEKLILIKRSNKVGEYPGYFDVMGGHIDIKPEQPTIWQAMDGELEEELGLQPDDYTLELIGICENKQTRKPELVFQATTHVESAQVLEKAKSAKDGYEYEKLIVLESSRVSEFLKENEEQTSPPGLASLVTWQLLNIGKKESVPLTG